MIEIDCYTNTVHTDRYKEWFQLFKYEWLFEREYFRQGRLYSSFIDGKEWDKQGDLWDDICTYILICKISFYCKNTVTCKHQNMLL